MKRHIFSICVSLCPVSMGRPLAEYTITSFEVKQPASQIGPIPTNVFVKLGMKWPSQGMPWPCCGRGSVAVAYEETTCTFAVPTCIFSAAVFIGPYGACGAIYRSDAPVSAIHVYTFGSEVRT